MVQIEWLTGADSDGGACASKDDLDRCSAPTTNRDRQENAFAAFVQLNLDDNGDVTIVSSKHLQHLVDSIATDDVRRQLRTAHQSRAPNAFPDPGTRVHLDAEHPTTIASASAPSEHAGRNSSLPDKLWAKERRVSQGPNSRRNRSDVNLTHESDLASIQSPAFEDLNIEEKITAARRTHTKCLLISDSAKVAEFLESRLRGLQQNALKRLAKAWIKGICPKKQAKFPYQKGDEVPKWWPPTDACPFKEPDHIKKGERLQLCFYLLRLRPTPAQLEAWNNHFVKPHTTHVSKGWTAFLMEVAPPTMMSDLRDARHVTEKRRRLLDELYEVSRLEENFKQGAVDASTHFQWCDDEAKLGGTAQSDAERPGRANNTSKRSRGTSAASESDSDSRASTRSTGRSKRPRSNPSNDAQLLRSGTPSTTSKLVNKNGPVSGVPKDSQVAFPFDVDDCASSDVRSTRALEQHDSNGLLAQSGHNDRGKSSRYYDIQPLHSISEDEPGMWSFQDDLPTYQPWTNEGTCTNSFNSWNGSTFARPASSNSFRLDNGQATVAALAQFPCLPPDDKPGDSFEDPAGIRQVANTTPRPYFDTVPNTPIEAPNGMFSMQLDQSAPENNPDQPHWPMHGLAMNPHQHEFMIPTTVPVHPTSYPLQHPSAFVQHLPMQPGPRPPLDSVPEPYAQTICTEAPYQHFGHAGADGFRQPPPQRQQFLNHAVSVGGCSYS